MIAGEKTLTRFSGGMFVQHTMTPMSGSCDLSAHFQHAFGFPRMWPLNLLKSPLSAIILLKVGYKIAGEMSILRLANELV